MCSIRAIILRCQRSDSGSIPDTRATFLKAKEMKHKTEKPANQMAAPAGVRLGGPGTRSKNPAKYDANKPKK